MTISELLKKYNDPESELLLAEVLKKYIPIGTVCLPTKDGAPFIWATTISHGCLADGAMMLPNSGKQLLKCSPHFY